jgi:hypothetical protein
MLYPAILNMYGVDELILLQDEADWRGDLHLPTMLVTAQDRLIDSQGAQFSIAAYRSGELISTGEALSLAEVMTLIQRHAAQDGACCIEKINAKSIATALLMIA